MLEMVPAGRSRREPLREVYPAIGRRKARVGLLAGCAQQVLSPGINRAAIRVLNRNGVEVIVPATQACCGALAMHVGAEEEARATAGRNLAAFPDDLDAVITTAAGCGSGMQEYGLLFRGEPEEKKATTLAEKTRDICTFLDSIGFTPPEDAVGEGQIVAYHDACHLAHAQGVRDAPRRLLEAIPGLTLRIPGESEICCGSAGTYNIEHPDTARILGRRKAENLTATGADVIATGNIGCLVQIAKHLAGTSRQAPVRHTVELLDSKT
jgi:glycolate oxidase iron-sulfur subunit